MSTPDERKLLFKAEEDRFKGVTVCSTEFGSLSHDEFKSSLQTNLNFWRSQKRRGIWLKILKDHSSLIPLCIDFGFDFHHAKPGFVMLVKWLPSSEPNHLPVFASHSLGVGGLVYNEETKEILLVKEKYASTKIPMWHLPGGQSDQGEDFDDVAIREVEEETGVKTKFVNVICFRHQLQYRFETSDFYFVCLLKPLTTKINFCSREISACRWMKVNEFLMHDEANPFNKQVVREFLRQRENNVSINRLDSLFDMRGILYVIKIPNETITTGSGKRKKCKVMMEPNSDSNTGKDEN